MDNSCLFINGDTSGLFLEDIKRDTEDRVVEGWVINGGWLLVLHNDEVLCKDHNGNIKNRFPYKSAIEIQLNDYDGDYNSVLAEARKQL